MSTQQSTTIVTSISEFEQLILVCKKHNITALRLGDIEMQIPADVKPEQADHSRSEAININAEAFLTYKNL